MKRICALWAVLAGAALLQAGPAPRIHRGIDNNETFVLGGHKRALVNTARDIGEADASFQISQLELHFQMTPAQAADLKNLLALQRDRKSGWYHKWLTPEQFAERFGGNESDLKKMQTWLEEAGFTNVQAARSRTSVRMSGTAGNVNNLFGVAIHEYERGGKQFFANSADPVLPRALEGLISGVKGLTNYRARPFIARKPAPKISIGINGNHFLGPDDLATIYNLHTLYNQGTDGTGQTIAVVGQSDIQLSDIEAFQKAAGLPIKDPQIIMAGEDPGTFADDSAEADLDLEWTGAVARGATILYVNSQDVFDSAAYVVENNLAPVISISYGLCEPAMAAADLASFNAVLQQASAQGITVVVSSGDTGAAACDVDQDATGTPETTATLGLAVNFPASSPYVTAVGGTEFDEAQGDFWDASGHAKSYIPEIAWNDTAAFKALSGSGGGVSQQFAKPQWQLGSGVPADSYRDVPDIALSSSPVHDAYLICSGGSCSNWFAPPVIDIYFVGGTSCAAPVFAGVVALLNQSSDGRQGNMNPGLYELASFGSGVFHDVELGDNRVPCEAGTSGCTNGSMGYSAGPGYDQVTGLGSIDATQLVEQWGSDFQLALNPASLSISSGGSGNAGVQVTRFANFSGNVTFTCTVDGSLTNTTCSIPGSVNGSGVATLTVTNTAAAKNGRLVIPFGGFRPNSAMMLLAGMGAASLLLWSRRRKVAAFGGVAICVLALAGCGSGDSNSSNNVSMSVDPPTLKGNVTVTATSGVLQRVITVPVTIS